MNVVFRSKSPEQNRFTITDSKFGKLFFDKGVYVTSDKKMIEALLNHPLKRRGDIMLETNDELVSKYLEGKEADKLTKETLNTLTRQGVIELGAVLGSSEKQPTLIKAEVLGMPITDAVQEILDFYVAAPEPEPKQETQTKVESKPEVFDEVEAPKKKPGRPKKQTK